MNYEVIVSPEGIEDLQKIYDYIAYEKKSIINAESLISRIENEIVKLDFMPNKFKLYQKEPWKSLGLRYFHIDNYLIFYIVDDENKTVTVLRIIYGKMDLTSIWEWDCKLYDCGSG